MSKRTTTSKGLRAKTRKLNRTNESLAADLKATNVALGKATDKINELEGQVNELNKRDTSDTEETVSPPA